MCKVHARVYRTKKEECRGGLIGVRFRAIGTAA